MQGRMTQAAIIIPGAMERYRVWQRLPNRVAYQRRHWISFTLRPSQINGCSVCVDMGLCFKKADETNERLFAVSAWKNAHYFTDAERAGLVRFTASFFHFVE
jgi:hypothetical protein